MTLIGEAEAVAAEVIPGGGWIVLVKRHWKAALGLVGFVGLGIMLLMARADARHWREAAEHEKAAHALDIAQAKAAAEKQRADDADRIARASDAYAARAAALQPLIVHSTNEVTRYAETPAGAVLCRDPDRVRAVDALDAALDAPGSAPGHSDPVPADASAPPGGR